MQLWIINSINHHWCVSYAYKYTDLVMIPSAMVGNELVLEREKIKLFTKRVVKIFILLKWSNYLWNSKQWTFSEFKLLVRNSSRKKGDHILPLAFSDFTDCFTRISWEEISGTLTSLLVDISRLSLHIQLFPLKFSYKSSLPYLTICALIYILFLSADYRDEWMGKISDSI